MKKREIFEHNQKAWDYSVEQQYKWSVPVDAEVIVAAKEGRFQIFLSPKTPVPHSWVDQLKNKKVLGLASGGGQQGPILAALGAEVVILDISPAQLELDQSVAKQFGLQLKTELGNAEDLSQFSDESFDFIINPVSNCFFPELPPVWKECHRVLKKNGEIIFAFNNPVGYQFDFEQANRGHYHLKYGQPFSDLISLSENEKKRFLRPESPLEFGHSMEQQLGDLINSGFVICGFFEDKWDHEDPINQFIPSFFNVRGRKI